MKIELDRQFAIGEIDASPKGPRVAAFFDLDGTLIAGYSALMARGSTGVKGIGARDVLRALTLIMREGLNEETFAELTELGSSQLAGKTLEELEEIGQKLFAEKISDRIYPEMREIVEAHRRRGHTVVLCSSASPFQAEPVAHHLDIRHVLCNRFIVENGVLTGKVERPLIWGPGKALAVQTFAEKHRIDLDRSYFYADGDEELALMHLIGNPRPTNPGKRLEKMAQKRGWPSLRFTSRGAGGVGAAMRLAAGYAAMPALAGAGLVIGLVEKDKRAGIDFTIQRFLDLSFALNGVKLNVIGEENAWSERPAVFLVNHRNTFDGTIAMKIVGKEFGSVAKGELGANPIARKIGDFLDVAFVDRQDTTNAIATLRQVEELARKGISILIAPEGTRLDTTRVGPFKKGAFRVAMNTGLPIVPIVIRNAEVLGGHNAIVLNPGTVDVAVLPPISVKDWRQEDLDRHIASVRQLFIETLSNWPK